MKFGVWQEQFGKPEIREWLGGWLAELRVDRMSLRLVVGVCW